MSSSSASEEAGTAIGTHSNDESTGHGEVPLPQHSQHGGEEEQEEAKEENDQSIQEAQGGGVNEASEEIYPPEFANIPFKTIVEKLISKTRTTSRGKTTTMIPKSYKKLTWHRLIQSQRGIVLGAWAVLPQEEKNTMIEENEKLLASLTTGGALVSDAAGAAHPSMARAPSTSQDDRCRMLHLLHDPAFAYAWTAAHESWTRSELDRQPEDRIDHWGTLSSAFNDYVNNKYKNILYETDPDTNEIVVVPDYVLPISIRSSIRSFIGKVPSPTPNAKQMS